MYETHFGDRGCRAGRAFRCFDCCENGWTVKLVSSLASERAQSVMAEGGINAALNTKGEEDSPEQHYTDTLTAACGLADPNAVWGMTQAASELVRSLHHLGVQFNVTDDDELDLRNFGGQKKKRTAFAQSDTGKQLMTALIDAVRREESAGTVERFPHHKFRTLLLSGNICGGCTVQDTYTGELLRFVCDAVLIATGGLHGLFGDTTGSLANTGEVTAELFRLGVPMANLEMIQYHPTTVELGEKRMLLSEAARGEGGRLFALRNGKPWYFMEEKYPELGNLMPRDITAREVWTVSRDYEVFLDMTELPKEVMEHKLAGLVDDCQTYLHKDIRKEPIPILPGIHYFMGGIQVDERHRTSMRNLYAAGECCAQYHGANRLAPFRFWAVPCWKVPSPEKKAGVRTGGQIIPNATMPFTAKPPWHTGTGSISPSALNPSPKGGMIYELHHPNQTAGKPAGFTLLAGVFL